jgi:energy-coupling factor transporter ATP-binding protein EcfA2
MKDMLTSLHLTRFKVWQDTGDVALGPVTMLLGANSSGKSTLIQSLLLLKQTVQSPDRTVHLNLGGDEVNDLFHFGGFDDVLYRATPPGSRQFAIGFGFAGPQTGQGHFHATYARTASGGTVVQSLRMGQHGRQLQVLRREHGTYSVIIGDEAQPRIKGRHCAPLRSIALPAEAIAALGEDGSWVEDLGLAVRRELEGIHYLGPLRRRAQRDYAWNRTQPGELGVDGRAAVDALLASALLKGEDHHRIVAEVSEWFARMRLAERLEVRQLGRSQRYELVVHRDGTACNLYDVGVGVSQVLPVLVLAHFAPAGSTILLEEPEIHLHPFAQAVLAELFVEVGRQRQVQFVVETHSEHLFRRMQTLVAREHVGPHDVALYFVERRGPSASLRALGLDEYGRLLHWPQGFFGEVLNETREQARLMFERQRRTRQPGGSGP